MENAPGYLPETSDTENLLDDVVRQAVLSRASSGKRFFNHLIDYAAFYVLWRVLLQLLTMPLAHLLVNVGYTPFNLFLEMYLLAVLFEVTLMTLSEFFWQGKTLGKLATGTRVVNEDGTRLTFRTALLRSLCRCVPFDAFSAFGSPSYPWHDRWSKTYVIDDRESSLPPELA